MNERIISGLEIKERVERIVDQRIGKGMDLQDRPVREMDVQQPLQSPLDMGEHIGGRQQLPGMAPGIVDAEERFGLLVPGNQRKIVGETIQANGAAQARMAKPTPGCGSGAGGTIAGAAGTLAGTVSPSGPALSRTGPRIGACDARS